MKIPQKHLPPPGIEQAMLVCETGFTPDQLDAMPQSLIERILVYKGVSYVSQHGGTYNP